MGDLILLSEAQMRQIEPYFPLSHGVRRVDDRRVISGIVFVIRNGLRWLDVPRDYGPHKTIHNRFVRAWHVQQDFCRACTQGGQILPADDRAMRRTAIDDQKNQACGSNYLYVSLESTSICVTSKVAGKQGCRATRR